MLRFLNNDRNNRNRPNENLARELMELFTLGEGRYSETDVKELARALTGYAYDDNDFEFRQRQHDPGTKSILGSRGKFDGDDAVLILLRQRACARFVALRLYRELVADVSDDYDELTGRDREIVDALAAQLRKEEYQLGPVLETLLTSRAFYDEQVIGRRIKSPLQMGVGLGRELGIYQFDTGHMDQALKTMGQVPFTPPNVAGWPGGRAWINTSTLLARQNFLAEAVTGRSLTKGKFRRGDPQWEPDVLLDGFEKPWRPDAVAKRAVDVLIGEHLPEARRAPVVSLAKQKGKSLGEDDVVAVVTLVTAPAGVSTSLTRRGAPPCTNTPTRVASFCRSGWACSPQPRACRGFLTATGQAWAQTVDPRLSSQPGQHDDRVLVVVQLSGGNDGLNTVIPLRHARVLPRPPPAGDPLFPGDCDRQGQGHRAAPPRSGR